MADELTIYAEIKANHSDGAYKNGGWGKQQFQADQTNPGDGPGLIYVGTSDLAVDLSGFTAPGWAKIRNLSDSALVTWGTDDGGGVLDPTGEIPAGMPTVFYFPTTSPTLVLKSDTASTPVEVRIFER